MVGLREGLTFNEIVLTETCTEVFSIASIIQGKFLRLTPQTVDNLNLTIIQIDKCEVFE